MRELLLTHDHTHPSTDRQRPWLRPKTSSFKLGQATCEWRSPNAIPQLPVLGANCHGEEVRQAVNTATYTQDITQPAECQHMGQNCQVSPGSPCDRRAAAPSGQKLLPLGMYGPWAWSEHFLSFPGPWRKQPATMQPNVKAELY